MNEFITILNDEIAEVIEKKSKFIANIYHVETIEEAEEKIKSIKKKYHDARHNCVAYRVAEDGKKAERMIRNFLDNRDILTKEELSDLVTQAKQYNIVIISNEEYIKKAERQSFNARIQGSAATLTKKIMGMVYRDSLIRKLGGRIVFQIHDELILDCPTEYAEAVRDRLKAIIENSSNSVGIVLPMKCDMTVETRWGEDTMTSELRVAYQELIAEGVENPLDKLCEEFCNFPKESICKIIHNDNKILEFEW